MQLLRLRGFPAIPDQAFFDSNGMEVFMHDDFYPQKKIEKNLLIWGEVK